MYVELCGVFELCLVFVFVENLESGGWEKKKYLLLGVVL